jgi:hypothetical protein
MLITRAVNTSMSLPVSEMSSATAASALSSVPLEVELSNSCGGGESKMCDSLITWAWGCTHDVRTVALGFDSSVVSGVEFF